MKSWKKPTSEIIEKALASVKKETDRQYFFSRLKNPLWIQPLAERGYFQSPPEVRRLPDDDGFFHFPFWPEFQYLKNVCVDAPDEVVELALKLPKVNNPLVYDHILEIALNLHGEQSGKLKPKILEYTDIEHQLLSYKYAELIAHWTAESQTTAALELSKILVKFRPDPKSGEEKARRKDDPENATLKAILKPAPRFDQWEYEEILNKGIHPLAESEPDQVARILIDAVAGMIRLQIHQDGFDGVQGEDYSEVWCPQLDKPDNNYLESKEALVHTLTFACEQVFAKSLDAVAALDEALRNQRWQLFKRLRQHLYALHPNDQTKPWIRELILTHKDYSEWDHHYEFQRMIRCACERFGTELLTEDERMGIFDAIISGPSKAAFREWMGEGFNEEKFKQRRRDFHRKQFRPFASVLFGEYSSYFRELEVEADKQISDESYLSVSNIRGGTVSYRSPKPPEDLANLTDEELLSYINEWQEERYDKDDWLTEINIEALAAAFQTVFKDSIIPNADRLGFWTENRERIERPIYVRKMVKEIQEHVKAKNFDKLDEWLTFCEWVLSHPDRKREEDYEISDESRENRHWHRARRAVGDFIRTCLGKEVDVPISARKPLATLLEMLCTQFDRRLDRNQRIPLNPDNQLTDAINNTRSRALEDLSNFVSWVWRHEPGGQVSEVATILEKRFAPQTKYPLTLPERAILGMNCMRIFRLDEAWATRHKSDFFPQDSPVEWLETFGSFLRFHRPFKPTFEILRDDFDFALKHLGMDDFKKRDSFLTDILGQHLFTYYLWKVYPLRGEESLLEQYYKKTEDDPVRWAKLFDHVGSSLQVSSKNLDADLKKRVLEFFDWRFEVEESAELQKFSSWMGAECLDVEWRLDYCSKILDLGQFAKGNISSMLKALAGMPPDHTAMVVKCFAQLTGVMLNHDTIYIHTDQAKPILKTGLESSDEDVREDAERARENLLRIGRFEFLDMD